MADGLIKERHTSYAPRGPLALGNHFETEENPFVRDPRYSSTVASCKDFPLPSHAAKSLFVEPEQEISAQPAQEEQLKLKESFLKRLSISNMKMQVANIKTHILTFFARVKDTLSSWQNQIWDFFGRPKTDKKSDAIGNNVGNALTKKSIVTKQTKAEQTQYAAAATKQAKTEKTQEADESDSSKIDLDQKRINEIEDTMAAYEAELQRSSCGNMKTMLEMLCKIVILLGSLGYRYNKKEMQDYLDHLEVSIQKQVKTFEGGRKYYYIATGFLIGASVFSFASMGSGLFAETSKVGGVLKGLGGTVQPLSGLGDASKQIGGIDDQKKQGERTEYSYQGDRLKQARTDMASTNEKTHQSCQEMFAAIRNAEQARNEAAKRAIAV